MTDSILLGKFKSLHKDKHKILLGRKMLWLMNIAFVSWTLYNLTMLVIKYRIANTFIAHFPAIR